MQLKSINHDKNMYTHIYKNINIIYIRHVTTLLKSVYSPKTLSSQLVLHMYTSGDSRGASVAAVCRVCNFVSLHIHVDISM